MTVSSLNFHSFYLDHGDMNIYTWSYLNVSHVVLFMHGSKFSDMDWIMLVSLVIWIKTTIIAKYVALVQIKPIVARLAL